MPRRFAAIAVNTFIETIRQPIFSVLMWIAAGLLVINPSLALFSLQAGRDNKIMQDVGLATLLLFGLLASAFSATGVVTREIENRTVLTVISKPVSRMTFVLAKYFGVVGAMLVAYFFLTTIFLMTVRHGVMETVSDKYDYPVMVFSGIGLGVSLIAAAFGNFFYGWHFPTALTAWVVPSGAVALVVTIFFDPEWHLQSASKDFGDLQILYAVLLNFFAVLVMTAFAVAFSTRFSQVMTLIFCAAVFMLGLLSDYLIGTRADDKIIYQALYAIVPNFQFYWLADALTQDLKIDVRQVLRVIGYSMLYIPAVLALAVAMFQTREVG